MTLTLFTLFAFASFLSNLLLTPAAIRAAHRFGFLDVPGHRKIHSHPVPKLGGVALLAAILLSVWVLRAFHWVSFTTGEAAKLDLILVVVGLSALLGFLDDLFDLKPRRKLVFQALLCGAFALFGFNFGCFHLPGLPSIPLSFLGVPLTMFWMMAVLNGFNFMDGVDGLAGSVTVTCLAGTTLAALGSGDKALFVLSASGLGAVVVFLLFNKRPAAIYLGDTGSNALGMLVAASLASLGSVEPAYLSFLAPSRPPLEPERFQLFAATLLCGYPILEVGLSTLRRAVKRFFYGRSMSWSEKEHIHHRLLKWGLGANRISALAALIQGLLAAAALLVFHRQNALATWILVPLAMALAYLLPRFGFLDFLKPSLLDKRHHFLIAHHFISMQRSKLGLVSRRTEALLLAEQAFHEFGVRNFHLVLKPGPNGEGGLETLHHWDQGLEQDRLTHILPIPEEGEEGVSDSYQLPGGKGWARWVFEHKAGQEEELDVECRVLVREFVKESLETAIRLVPVPEPLPAPLPGPTPVPQVSSPRSYDRTVSGHNLRKRHRPRELANQT